MTLESALFPFLFPHRNGACDGRTILLEYLKYHIYTNYIYYTYMTYADMYNLKENSQTCLNKEIKQTKQIHTNMNDAEIL